MAPTRDAACSCGPPRLTAEGDPIRITMCHCHACQRRTGSAFGVQARIRSDQVGVVGRSSDYARTSDEEDRAVYVFHPAPTVSIYESRQHPWLAVTTAVEHHD
jgi:hypothetical protein